MSALRQLLGMTENQAKLTMAILTGSPFQRPLKPMLPYILDMACPPLSPANRRLDRDAEPGGADEGCSRLTFPIGVQFADHHIGRMTDDGASNTRNVAPQERDPRLLKSVIALLRLSQRGVDIVDSRLEGRELHHGIGDLPAPKRLQALVQPCGALFTRDLGPTFPHSGRIRRQGRLHADLDRLKGTQCHIGEELCRGGRAQVYNGLGRVGEQLVAIEVLEDLVEAVLAGSLEGVADEGGGPAEEDAAEAFFAVDGSPGRDVGAVDVGVDLATAFYEIEGGHGCDLHC